jgi:hypothetical protein
MQAAFARVPASDRTTHYRRLPAGCRRFEALVGATWGPLHRARGRAQRSRALAVIRAAICGAGHREGYVRDERIDGSVWSS